MRAGCKQVGLLALTLLSCIAIFQGQACGAETLVNLSVKEQQSCRVDTDNKKLKAMTKGQECRLECGTAIDTIRVKCECDDSGVCEVKVHVGVIGLDKVPIIQRNEKISDIEEKCKQQLELTPMPRGVDEHEPGSGGKRHCYVRGQWYQLGDVIETPDPCKSCKCTQGWIKEMPHQMPCIMTECKVPEMKPGNGHCKIVTPKDKCCPELVCQEPEPEPGHCFFKGKKFQHGELMNDDPCHPCTCDKYWSPRFPCVSNIIIDCAHAFDSTLWPGPDCEHIYIKGQCCPKYNCKGHKDFTGKVGNQTKAPGVPLYPPPQ